MDRYYQKVHIARHGGLPAHVFGFHGTDHGTDLQAFGHIVGMIHLADVGRGQSDLIAVARITGSGLEADDALGQFAGQRFAYGQLSVISVLQSEILSQNPMMRIKKKSAC